MIINVTNHPVSSWSDEQRTAAEKEFGNIIDLPFPNINPALNQDDIKKLAKDYKHRIEAFQPAAVHIMGEMTFTFSLVKRLKKIGIPCVASTSERIVAEEAGKKIVTFKFVRFRYY